MNALAHDAVPAGVHGGENAAPASAAPDIARRPSQHAVRRPGRRQRSVVLRWTRRHHRADRPQRRRQDDRVQLHYRLLQAHRRPHCDASGRSARVGGARNPDRARRAQHRPRRRSAVPARAHAGLPCGAQSAGRAHIPEHSSVPGHDRPGKSSGRPAQSADARFRIYRAWRAGASLLCACGARGRRQGALLAGQDRSDRARRRSGRRVALRRSAPPRDRARDVHASRSCCASTSLPPVSIRTRAPSSGATCTRSATSMRPRFS